MGNGHPVACVVTTEAVAQAMEDTKICYFNTVSVYIRFYQNAKIFRGRVSFYFNGINFRGD